MYIFQMLSLIHILLFVHSYLVTIPQKFGSFVIICTDLTNILTQLPTILSSTTLQSN